VSAYVCAWGCDDEADAGADVDARVLASSYAWRVCTFVVAEYKVPAFAGLTDRRVSHCFDRFIIGDALEVVACLLRVDIYDQPSCRAGNNANIRMRQFFPLASGCFGIEDRIGRAMLADWVLSRLRA